MTMMTIPQKGLDKDAVWERLESFRAEDLRWRNGRSFAYVYDAGREAEEVTKRAFTMFMSENGLDPTAYPSLLQLENEIIAMAAAHLGGDEATVGSFTSGGTESILLAVKTARDYFREKKPEMGVPEMILPVTAHAAFHKAAHYFGVKTVVIPVDPETMKADVQAMRDAITDNTVLLVGSAPGYAHGVVDPIAELGELALEHELLFHVDGCIGGFLLPYFRRLGADVPDFDLTVPGVTSISMDLHKYAYAAKGASVVLYKNAALRRHQIFACSTWSGYTVVNPTVQSTKSGGPLAAAWAVLHFIGDEGYLDLARRLLDASRRIEAGVEAIPDLQVLGRPEMPTLLAFTSESVNLFHIIDEMKERGWHLQPQLACGDLPANIHLLINPNNVDYVDAVLADLREVVEQVKGVEKGQLAEMIQQGMADVEPSQLDDAMFGNLLGMAGIQGVQLPERMASINEIMNALPPALSERLLIEFMNRLFSPARNGAH